MDRQIEENVVFASRKPILREGKTYNLVYSYFVLTRISLVQAEKTGFTTLLLIRK
jgi:hypothetical protein